MLEFNMQAMGYSAIMGYLGNFPHAVESGGNKALREIAPLVVEQAKANLVDYPAYITGDLFRSVYWHETETGIAIGALMAYAYFVEYGTSKMAAEPYLRPAIAQYLESDTGAKQIMGKIREEADKGAVAGATIGAVESSIFGSLFAIGSLALTGLTMAYGAMI